MRSGTRRKHSHTVYVSFIGYSKPDGALAQKVRNGLIEVATNLRVMTCKNPAIAVAKAISTVAKLNKKREDSKHMIATIWFMCVFQVISR